jgi:hypothetical protein
MVKALACALPRSLVAYARMPEQDAVNSSVSVVFIHVLTEHADEGRNRRYD